MFKSDKTSVAKGADAFVSPTFLGKISNGQLTVELFVQLLSFFISVLFDLSFVICEGAEGVPANRSIIDPPHMKAQRRACNILELLSS